MAVSEQLLVGSALTARNSPLPSHLSTTSNPRNLLDFMPVLGLGLEVESRLSTQIVCAMFCVLC